MPDRTTDAATRHLNALGSESFEIGALTPDRKMIQRVLSSVRSVAQIPRLKALNAQGHEIYVRPAGDHGWILIDDLARSSVDTLDRSGLQPSVVVETSPSNYQAWLWMGRELPAEERLELSRRLTRESGGDRGAIGSLRYGRLAGFTNRKEQHRQENGLSPFVLLHRAERAVVERAEEWITRARRGLAATEFEHRPAGSNAGRSVGWRVSAEESFERAFAGQIARTGGDRSAADYRAALILDAQGFDRDAIARAMLTQSPDLETRKGKNAQAYVDRTVANALARARPKEFARSLAKAAGRLRNRTASQEVER